MSDDNVTTPAGMKMWGPVYDREALAGVLGALPGSTAKKVGSRWLVYVPRPA